MKRTLLMMALIAVSIVARSQSVVKYERFNDDGHIRHNCINAFEASDGTIIMMEECCDTITDYSGEYTESVNLLKINPQGVLVDLTKVDFSATSQNSPFLRVPSENNSNVMGGLYLNESNELRYTAIFFDDNLSITNNIDVAFPVDGFMITDGFTTTYKSIVDSNGDLILMSMKNDSDDTYVFVKMSVYGEIKTIKYSVSEKYKNCYLTERSLYIHSNDPLEYGCYFTKGSSSKMLTVILDENFEIMNLVDIDEYEENGEIYVFDCSESEMMCLKDGNILMSSIVRDKAGWNNEISEYIQLTKFNKEYEIVAYTRVASQLLFGDENHFHINTTKSILEDENGNIYLIWKNTDGEYIVSFLSNKLELIWNTTLDQGGAIITLLYDAFILENNKLVVYGDSVSDVGYFGVCYIISNNNTISVTENLTNNNISIYPNPAEDNIVIETDCITQIEIYNTVGQMVERVGVDDDSVEINVSAYNSGIYLMKITLSNGQTYSEKVVVR